MPGRTQSKCASGCHRVAAELDNERRHSSPSARVGYGGRYTARDEQRIGIVAAGYADGYPRHAPTGTPVLVDGVRTMTVGTVSMDMLAVDLTPCPQAGIGTPVELWGKEVKIDDVHKLL